MTNPPSHPPLPPEPDILEPADPDFFDRHKTAIIWSSIGVVLLILLVGVLQILRHSSKEKAAAEFSQADTTEQLEELVEKRDGLYEANARLLLAARYRADGRFDDATKILADFSSEFPKHPLRPYAAMSEAATLESRGDLQSAATAYRQITTEFSDSAVAAYASLSEGRMLRLLDKTAEARRALESTITRYPGTASAQEAMQEVELLPPAPPQTEDAQATPSVPAEAASE